MTVSLESPQLKERYKRDCYPHFGCSSVYNPTSKFFVGVRVVFGIWLISWWSLAAYKADNKFMVIVLGVLAAMAAAGSVVWAVGIYQ